MARTFMPFRNGSFAPLEDLAREVDSLVQNIFDPEERAQALAVPLFYGAVEAFVIMIYCIWAWKAGWTKASSKDSICKVIGKSYEVDELEHEMEDAARAA